MVTRTRTLLGTLVILGLLVAAASLMALTSRAPGSGSNWIDVGSLGSVQRAGVQKLEGLPVYLVPHSPSPIALYPRSPHLGEYVDYCRSSGWFEDKAHGEKFNVFGDYMGGPSPRGMDLVAIRVTEGEVFVSPAQITPGHDRTYLTPGGTRIPSGPFCV